MLALVNELFIMTQLAIGFSCLQSLIINASRLALGINCLSDSGTAILTSTEWNCHRRIDSNGFGNGQTFPQLHQQLVLTIWLLFVITLGDPLPFPLICKCTFEKFYGQTPWTLANQKHLGVFGFPSTSAKAHLLTFSYYYYTRAYPHPAPWSAWSASPSPWGWHICPAWR